MKKIIFFIACITILSLNGMNDTSHTKLLEITPTSLSIKTHGTIINLFKGSPYYPKNPISITVVGNNEQQMLSEGSNSKTIGNIYCDGCNLTSIYERSKDKESDSDDDTYKSYPHQIEKQTWRDSKQIKSLIMHIEEPCIGQCSNNKDIFTYTVRRPIDNNTNYYMEYHYSHEAAILEASKDLALCYDNVLCQGLKKLHFMSAPKHIALPTLSADVGFPRDKAAPIAIKRIFNFIQNNSNQYESINFFVKKHSDFVLYKKLLILYLTQNVPSARQILLLYCSRQKNNNSFSILPHEIINHIAQLAYTKETIL